MKPFNLEAAKAGAPIQDRRGNPAKFVAHVPEAEYEQRVVLLHDGQIRGCSKEGYCPAILGRFFMAPVKRTVWVNLYPGRIANWHPDQASADTAASADTVAGVTRIGGRAYPIEIEE